MKNAFKQLFDNAKTECVNTHELQEGDIIRHYGWLFRLSNRKDCGVWDDHDPLIHGSVITLQCECLYSREQPDVVAPIVSYDVVQGNKLAHWGRVLTK